MIEINETEFNEILLSLLEQCEINHETLTRYEIVEQINLSGKFGNRMYEDHTFQQLYLNFYNSLSLYKKNSADKLFFDNYYNYPIAKDKSLFALRDTTKFSVIRNASETLTVLENSIDLQMETEVRKAFHELKNVFNHIEMPKASWFSLTGKSNVKKFTEKATEVYCMYKELIEGYEIAKFSILQAIEEYTQLRQQLKYEREDLVNMLKDVYGKEIFEAYPQLYDFNKLQWLETENLFYDLDTRFEQIQGKYETFQNQLSENIQNVKNQVEASFGKFSNSIYKGNKLRKSDAILESGMTEAMVIAESAFSNILNSRVAASEKCAEIKKDIEFMKLSFAPDHQMIMVDITRLFEIYTNIKRIFIPLAEAYAEHFNNLLNGNLQTLLVKYRAYKYHPLFVERENLILEERDYELSIIEHQKSLVQKEQYLDRIKSHFENEIKPVYEVYIENKITEPSILSSILSLGLNTLCFAYANEIWVSGFAPIDKEYQTYSKEIQVTKNDISHYNNRIKELNQLNKKLEKEIKQKDKLVQQEFSSLKLTQFVDVSQIANINSTLALSKEILEKGLRNNLTDPVSYLSKLTFIKPLKTIDNYGGNKRLSSNTINTGNKLLEINNLLASIKDRFVEDMTSTKAIGKLEKQQVVLLRNDLYHYIDKENILQLHDLNSLQESITKFLTHKIQEKTANHSIGRYVDAPAFASTIINNCKSFSRRLGYIKQIRELEALNKNNDNLFAQLESDLKENAIQQLETDFSESQELMNRLNQNTLNIQN